MTVLDRSATDMMPAAPARAARGMGSFLRALANRRHIGRLAGLSNDELADIGLRPMDLLQALREPLRADPTLRLSKLADERHAADYEAWRRR